VRGHGGAGEVDAAEGARVRGEGAGHGGGGEGVGVGVGEDERRRGPDATPAPGERGGARGVLGGRREMTSRRTSSGRPLMRSAA
jgi:hypothetical protein